MPNSSNQSTIKSLVSRDKVSSALKNDMGGDAILKSFEIVDFVAPGEGYISFVTSVEVVYAMNDEEKSTSYVVKINGGCGETLASESQRIFFAKESAVLFKFLPLMNEILEECNQEPLCIPVCYFASLEPGKEILFLQDMRTSKFKKIKDEHGFDVDHAKVIINELARFHASYVLLTKSNRMKNLEDRTGIMAPSYSKEKFSVIHKLYSPLYKALLENAADIADSTGNYSQLAAFIRKIAGSSFEILEDLLSKSNPPFTTVCQADCWVNNMLFRYDESGKLLKCCLLDFQMSYTSSLCVDLNYFLYSTLSGGVRRDNLRNLLTTYHDSYSSVFKSAGVDMEFDVDELHQELKRYHLCGLLFASFEVYLRIIESLNIPDVDLSGADSAQKMRDFQKRFSKEIMSSPKLRPRLFDTFDDLLKEGIIEKF